MGYKIINGKRVNLDPRVSDSHEIIQRHNDDKNHNAEIKHTRDQLRMSKGQPLREEYFRQKLQKLERG